MASSHLFFDKEGELAGKHSFIPLFQYINYFIERNIFDFEQNQQVEDQVGCFVLKQIGIIVLGLNDQLRG